MIGITIDNLDAFVMSVTKDMTAKIQQYLEVKGQETESYLKQNLDVAYPPSGTVNGNGWPAKRTGELQANVGHVIEPSGGGISLVVYSARPSTPMVPYWLEERHDLRYMEITFNNLFAPNEVISQLIDSLKQGKV